MAFRFEKLPDELLRLLPLTPAVFYTLFALAEGQRHGYAIMQQAKILSGGRFGMGPGTLYTTIQRLLEFALIEETAELDSAADKDSRRRYYRLTKHGKALLEMEISRMRSTVRLARDMNLAPEA
ncbi:MAG: helix-turn-helix transcriptional regulator [Bryobacteraceae bacterium]|jgi:DNA-binding PadR family transcriptional regulator